MLTTASHIPSSQGPVIPTTRTSISMATTCVQQAALISKPSQATPFASGRPIKMACLPKSSSRSPSRTSTKPQRISRFRQTRSLRTLLQTQSSAPYRPPMSTAETHSPIPSSQGPVMPTTRPSTSMATTCVQQAASISKPSQATPFESSRLIKMA